MAQQILNVLSTETIDYILSRQEVVDAKMRVRSKQGANPSEYFTIPLTPNIRSELFDHMGLQLSNITAIPMRWIKGDTPAHHDNGISTFTHTYLVYLTNSNGSLVIDGVTYPISRGYGYRFSEGLTHETVGTTDDDAEPRLLLGPMSESGFAVGWSGISYPGGTTVYLRQTAVGQEVLFSTDLNSDISTWSEVPWPCYVSNSDTELGMLNVVFMSNITLDTEIGDIYGYFICQSESIQFGSRALMPNGIRPIITFDGVMNYLGLIENGNSSSNAYNNVHIMNLEIRTSGGSTLANEAGWFGQYYFGKGTTTSSNIILNCHSTGDTTDYCGGIVGRYAGPLKLSHCSSSGTIGLYGGGIVGTHSPSSGVLTCESCWSSGNIGEYGGGITGMSTAIATVVNCYSTGIIGNHGGGICGSSSGGNNGTNMLSVSECYSIGVIGDGGGGIIGRSSGVLVVSNCYSLGYINSGASGILGNLAGNNTNKTVSSCYVAGAMDAAGGYVMPGYTDLTGNVTVVSGVVTLLNNFAEVSVSNSGWTTSRANNVLQGVPASASSPIGVKWVYTGTNTPYEILAMGFTPYARIVVTGSPPAMIRSFDSSVVAGKSSDPAIISGRSYSILRITGGTYDAYGTITMNATTGSISTTKNTIPGEYTITVRNNGSYHITTYTLTVTPYIPYSLFGLFTNNAQVYYKSHSLASGGIGGVRNHRRKARKT